VKSNANCQQINQKAKYTLLIINMHNLLSNSNIGNVEVMTGINDNLSNV